MLLARVSARTHMRTRTHAERHRIQGQVENSMCVYVSVFAGTSKSTKAESCSEKLLCTSAVFLSFSSGGGGAVDGFLSGSRGHSGGGGLKFVCAPVRVSERVGEARWRKSDRGITGVDGCLDRQSA